MLGIHCFKSATMVQDPTDLWLVDVVIIIQYF